MGESPPGSPNPATGPLIFRPYDEDRLPTYEQIHATDKTWTVHPGVLRPTQPMLDLARLLAIAAGEGCEGPDPYPHVVCHDGALWVHDGHHRWVVALLRGDPWITVRVTPV